MDPETLNSLKSIVDQLQSAYQQSGGNWLLLLPWVAFATVQLYKLPLVQGAIGARWPSLSWSQLKLGYQLALAFALGALPILGGQLILGVPVMTALVAAVVAGIAAVAGYKPARALAAPVVTPLASRLNPRLQSAMSIVVPLDTKRLDPLPVVTSTDEDTKP